MQSAPVGWSVRRSQRNTVAFFHHEACLEKGGLGKVTQGSQHNVPDCPEDTPASSCLYELARGIHHALDDRADVRSLAEDNEFEQVARDKCDILAPTWIFGHVFC